MNHLILHCGGPKTGSSALQNTLTKNITQLRGAGLYYPQIHDTVSDPSDAIMGNAVELAMAASKRNRATASGVPEENFLQDANSLLSLIIQASSEEVVLLSTEWLSNLSEIEWHWVAEFLSQTEREVSTITYFRPQVDQISSALGQFIKIGARPNLENCIQYMSSEAYLSAMSYYKTMCRLPFEDTVIAMYNRSALFKDDITADFFAHVERITGTRAPQLKTSSEINPSLNGDALTLMYSLNRITPNRNENALILEIFMRIPEFRPAKNHPQLILSEKHIEEAKAIFAKDNACAANFFGEAFAYLSRERENNEELVDIRRAPSKKARELFWDMWRIVAAEATTDRKVLMDSLVPRLSDALAQEPAESGGIHSQHLVTAAAPKLIPHASISPKAIVGKNSFLFLGGPDSNNIVKYFSGEEKISASAINIHRHNFIALKSTGLPYSVLIVPEAHVIYKDLLPNNISIVDDRPINRLIATLGESILYPLDELLQLREKGVPAYTGQDSHYTEFAAIECYKAVRLAHGFSDEFAPPYSPSIDRESGDLLTGDIVEVIKGRRALQSKNRALHFVHNYCNNVINNGRIAIYTNPQARGGRIMCFGTSFSEHLIPAYTTDFREVVFCYGTAVDDALVRLVEPERIFMEMPERFLHFPNMALAGSVLCSHSMRTEAKSASLAFSDSTPGSLGALSALLSELTDPLKAESVLLGSLIGPAALARIRFVRKLQLDGRKNDAIRALFAGHYRHNEFIEILAELIDSGPLAGQYDILPETEMGGIAKIRGLCRAERFREAAQVLERHMSMFGRTSESAYFTKYLLAKV